MIVKINNISDLMELMTDIDSDVLVIFDIDDVLFHPADVILQTQCSKEAQIFENNIDIKYSKEEADDIYSIIWKQRNIIHVDVQIFSFINRLHSHSVKTLALTNCIIGKFGRIHSVEDWRIQDLQKLGYHFDTSWNHLKSKIFEFRTPNAIKNFCYKAGVIFSNTINKGDVLERFLLYSGSKPKKVYS